MTSEDLPRRKKIRLEGYDYSANGLYFVTICVTEKYQVLWENVGANSETPTLSRVIKHFKEAVTKELGYSIWQKSFYDTIIKNRKQHAEIRQYIANNPAKYVKNAFDEQDMK